MANPTHIVITQPMLVGPQTTWGSGLFSCFDDIGICFYGWFCPFLLSYEIAGNMHECCCCGNSVAMRTLVRTKYRIQGSICDDYCVIMCCTPCSLCQIKREIKRQTM